MKNLKKLFLSLFVTVTAVVSCGDPDLPFEIYDTMKTGGYARLMSQTGEFNYFDQANSKVTLEVEYYDKNKGQAPYGNSSPPKWKFLSLTPASSNINDSSSITFSKNLKLLSLHIDITLSL